MAKHRASTRRRQRAQGAKTRWAGPLGGVAAAGVAGVALTGALALGGAPTLTSSPQLLAALHYLRGTNIGFIPSEQQYEDFIATVIDGSGLTPPTSYEEVPYNAGFRPFSRGGFADLSYNDSVAQGVQRLGEQQVTDGDLIFGFSQGAVAASLYKATHTGNTYVLVANPSRPNGGVMQRFRGLTIPFVDVTFSGPTPATGDYTVDVVRQYDGWADWPTYLWNPVAVANALMGIVLVHGNTQLEITAEDLELAEQAGSDYYQFDEDSNTAYYVVKTYPVPLLMPFDWLPDPILAALDAPLRWFIETAYDRTDYSLPLRSSFFAPWKLFGADVATVAERATVADVAEEGGEGESGDAVAARAGDASSAGEPGTPTDEQPVDAQGPTGGDGGEDESGAVGGDGTSSAGGDDSSSAGAVGVDGSPAPELEDLEDGVDDPVVELEDDADVAEDAGATTGGGATEAGSGGDDFSDGAGDGAGDGDGAGEIGADAGPDTAENPSGDDSGDGSADDSGGDSGGAAAA